MGTTVGTILETHPRASLLLALGDDYKEAVLGYKPKSKEPADAYRDRGGRDAVIELWKAWCNRYGIVAEPPSDATDGALDALVCATVGWLYHRTPAELERLTQDGGASFGRGPFYVARCVLD